MERFPLRLYKGEGEEPENSKEPDFQEETAAERIQSLHAILMTNLHDAAGMLSYFAQEIEADVTISDAARKMTLLNNVAEDCLQLRTELSEQRILNDETTKLWREPTNDGLPVNTGNGLKYMSKAARNIESIAKKMDEAISDDELKVFDAITRKIGEFKSRFTTLKEALSDVYCTKSRTQQYR